MPIEIKLYFDTHAEHTTMKVYVGPAGRTLALAGRLTMRCEEWTAFTAALLSGAPLLPEAERPIVRVVPEPVPGAAPAAAGGGRG
jgi:hypothetical protein